MGKDAYKNCPYCDEEIKTIAIKCRYCKSNLLEENHIIDACEDAASSATAEEAVYKDNYLMQHEAVEEDKNRSDIDAADKKSKGRYGWYIAVCLLLLGIIGFALGSGNDEIANDSSQNVIADNKVDPKEDDMNEVLQYTNGTYTGQVKNGEPHGIGSFLYNNCTEYAGEWKNGKMEGLGLMIYPSPACEELYYNYTVISKFTPEIYYGEWKDNIRHGHGIKYWPDGTKYEGYFADNDLIRGKITAPDGSFFYRDGLKHTASVPEWWDGINAQVPQWWYENPGSLTYSQMQNDVFSAAMNRVGKTESSDIISTETANYSYLVGKIVIVNTADGKPLVLKNRPHHDSLEANSIAGGVRLDNGTELFVADVVEKEWLIVKSTSTEYTHGGGFVHVADVILKEEYEYDDSVRIAYVDGSKTGSERLNLRSGPGTNYNITAKLNPDTKLKVINEITGSDGEQWLQVITGDGKEGWVNKGFIRWLLPQ